MAPPPLLALQGVMLTLGGKPLLEGADFAVATGARLCVVGRNGSGKSTLLKIAAGEIEPDAGVRFLQPGASLRYLPQEPDFSGFATALAYVEAGLGPLDDPHVARTLLNDLGLEGDENPARLSGGEARRAALARVLAPEPDILLLDEPTNHLDLPTILWLEERLATLRSALVLISHDRRFLQDLTRETLWIDRGRTRHLARGFKEFEAWRDRELEEEEKQQHKLERKIVAEEHWLRHGVSGRRKRNMKRLGGLHHLRAERRDRVMPTGDVKLEASEAQLSGKLVIEAIKIGKSYGERVIVENFTTRILRGDRIGIIGANGAGKTTLVNLLTGALAPDSGKVRLGANLEMATLEQSRAKSRSGNHLAGRADRRRLRHDRDQWRAASRHRLHEGFPVQAGTGAHAHRQAFGRRTRTLAACAGAGEAVESPRARRTNERPRSRNARSLRGNARRLSRHAHRRQP